MNATPIPTSAGPRRPARLLVALALLSVANLAAATLHVSLESPNSSPPYATWATAATNIQDAVDAAMAGDEILVTNGVYATGGRAVGTNLLANRVAVDKPLSLRSVNGPAHTTIQGAKAFLRCAYLADGASLSGFTLTNGWAPWTRGDGGGGVYCASASAVLTNCTLTGNHADWGGGARGGTLYGCTVTGNDGGGADDATLYHCTLVGNSGSGASRCTLYHCTLMGNSGTGASRCTLYCCTLVRNSAGPIGSGGGADEGTLYNCVLAENTAYLGGGAHRARLYNCTVTRNRAVDCPVPLACPYPGLGGGTAWSTNYNCIVYDNQASGGPDSVESKFEYSCVGADPRFVNATAGDFRLRPDSPCIDAGTNLTEFLTTDILGLPRPLDGNGDGVARFDMGAYEFDPYALRFAPLLRLAPDGFHFTVMGEPGRTVRVERSRDLRIWEEVAMVPVPASGQTLIDPAAASERMLFYRAVSGP